MSEQERREESPWKIGLRGARANLLPGLVLQVLAVSAVCAYYLDPTVRGWMEDLAEFRTATGLLYSAVATALFGGLIPFLYLRWNATTRPLYPWRSLIFLLLFWCYRGVEVDLFYRAQAALFGSGADVKTVAAKMLFDQLVYCPVWAVPVMAVLFAWKNVDYRWAPLRRELGSRFYARRVLAPLISTWGVWAPAVCFIYALPGPLQVPLFNLVLCFWSLLYNHMSTEASPRPAAAPLTGPGPAAAGSFGCSDSP